MSLILEALKKSEAQRRLGEAPTLGTPITSTRRRRSILPWLIVAIFIAGAGGWWLLRPRVTAEVDKRGPAVAATPAPSAPPAESPAAARRAAKAAARAAAAPPADGAAATPAISVIPPPRTAATTPAPSAPTPPVPSRTTTDAKAAANATGRTPVQTPAGAEPARTPAAAPATSSAPAISAMAPSMAPASTAAASATPSPSAPAAATAPASATPPPVSAPPMPTLYDLPADFREALPKLPVSMLFYSADPARRFILVDGERKKEGDVIGEVSVREIRATGAVLEFRGQRFLLPRPGS